MKNLVSTIAAVLMMAATVGTAVAQSGFTYKPYGVPLGSPGYQPTSGHPSSAFNYGGGYHTNSHGGFYYGGVGSAHLGGRYQNLVTGNRYGTHR